MLSEEKMMIALDAIGFIRRKLGYSYPYKAGSVTINCEGYDKTVLLYIIDWFMKRQASITINYEKKQVVIKGYMTEY
jgi:hypothetical protein